MELVRSQVLKAHIHGFEGIGLSFGAGLPVAWD